MLPPKIVISHFLFYCRGDNNTYFCCVHFFFFFFFFFFFLLNFWEILTGIDRPDSVAIHFKMSGPGCSKLTIPLVNVSLKFQMLISKSCQFLLLVNVSLKFQMLISKSCQFLLLKK